MLFYSEVHLSHKEIPGENSLCIYISGCKNKCPNCHYPELQHERYGDPLYLHFVDIIEAYSPQATRVCFLGEGAGTIEEQQELVCYANCARSIGLRTGLYCGRDTEPEEWMSAFTYIKVGSYKEALGPLDSRMTNQRMYMKGDGGYKDISSMFWVVDGEQSD